MIRILKSKIHRATVTETDLNYEGSLALSQELIEASGLIPYEEVSVFNINNGERFNTYVIPSDLRNYVCLNGAAARLGVRGDKIIILAFSLLSDDEIKRHKPKIVQVDDQNRIMTDE